MSFGFSTGDFIAVGDLAFNEVKDPGSTLVQGGEDRVRMVIDIVKGIGETLKRLERVAKKYEVLGSSSKGKHFWVKFKWSVECSSIDGLRSKLVYHNTMMNLLLTSVGKYDDMVSSLGSSNLPCHSSSLKRIETSNALLGKDLEAIKAHISTYQAKNVPSAVSPAVSIVEDDVFKETLSATFMKNAELTQPWSTIGVSQWIESGRWWLLLAQMELFTISAPRQAVPRAAYSNLIKASWILIDIIACHPQVPFLTASTQAEVRLLSADLKNEYIKISNLGAIVPELSELESQDLRIWEGQTTESPLRPHQDPRNTGCWKVAGGEQVLFQRYATCKLQALSDSFPCILLFLVHEDARSARVVAQNQNALPIMAISFHEAVTSVLDGCSVTVNGEQITFAGTTDAETLEVMIESTNFYLFERNVDSANLEDLDAYVLIFGVKNNFQETIARISQLPSSSGGYLKKGTQREPSVVAFSLASELKTSGQPDTSTKQHHLSDSEQDLLSNSEQDYKSISTPSLFDWAVYRRLSTLIELLISERVTWILGKAYDRNPDLLRRMMNYINHCKNEDTCQFILDSYLEAPNRDERESKALLESIRAGLEGVIRRLLRRNEALKTKKIDYGLGALQIAVREGRDIIVREMLELGWDVDVKSSWGDTPLMQAIKYGEHSRVLGVIALLLENGADVHAKDHRGMRVTHAALMSELPKRTVRLILAKAFEAHLPSQLPQPSGKRRRAEVIIDMDRSRLAHLFVDSYYASIEAPHKLPYGVTGKHRKYLRFNEYTFDNSVSTPFNSKPFSFKFTILFPAYPDAGLGFSVQLCRVSRQIPSADSPKESRRGEREETNKAMTFRVGNGGEYSIGTESWRKVYSFTVATDPNAELVESDIDSDSNSDGEKAVATDPDAELVDSDIGSES